MTKSTITRERAQQIFLGNGPEPSASEERELARIALAALESRTVKLPQCHIMPFREGFEDYRNKIAYKADEVHASLAAAGIKVEAE
ncbi:TPA: hypothetical protein ACQ2HS_001977 [Klebsiella pneumoniae]